MSVKQRGLILPQAVAKTSDGNIARGDTGGIIDERGYRS